MAVLRNPGLLAFMLVLILTTACAPSTPVVRDTNRPPSAEEDAEQFVRSGDHEAAALALQALAREPSRDASSAANFQLQAAEAWLRAGEDERARDVLDSLDSSALPEDAIARWHLAWAEAAYMAGDLATARLRLARANERITAADMVRFELIDELVLRAESNPARAAFAELESAVDSGRFTPEQALSLLIDHPLASLEALAERHGHRPDVAPWLDLVITSRRMLLDPPRLALELQAWETRYPTIGYSARAAESWLESWRQSRPMARSIMIALPGRAFMQPASQALRNGILTAWFDLRPEDRPELIFREVEDREDAILALWFEARERGVDAMIGPLERDQVDSLVALPDAGLPILLLNHPTDSGALEAMFGDINAMGLIPEEEAELAAVQALVSGHQRALILAQSSDWGQRVADAFESTFTLGGGQIMDRAAYSPAQPDQSALLEVLLNLDQSERRAADLGRLLGQAVEFEAQPRTDVDMIFLASRPDDTRLIRPQLRFFRVGELPVMGTSHLVAGAPDPDRDGDIDDVILPISPWFLVDSPMGQERLRSQRRFNNLDNPLLSILHALGADAFELSRWSSRLQADPDLYLAGRTGRLRLPSGRLVERDLPFVRLINGRADVLQ